jgi:hypothetical protein
VKKELALSSSVVVIPGALEVLRNVDILKPGFTVIDAGIAIDQACSACS